MKIFLISCKIKTVFTLLGTLLFLLQKLNCHSYVFLAEKICWDFCLYCLDGHLVFCELTGWQGFWHRYTGVWEIARFLLVARPHRFLVDERPKSSCRWNSLGDVVWRRQVLCRLCGEADAPELLLICLPPAHLQQTVHVPESHL